MSNLSIHSVLGRSIRNFRKDFGWTQKDLADRMSEHGFSWRRETVTQSEGEGRAINLSELLALCMIFNRSLDSFLIPTSDKRPNAPEIETKIALTEDMELDHDELVGLIRYGSSEKAPPTFGEDFSEDEMNQLKLVIPQIRAQTDRVFSELLKRFVAQGINPEGASLVLTESE